MDLIGSNDEELYTCHICKKSFDHIAALVLDEIIHKLNKKKSKRKKLNLKKYCEICCRSYASLSSLNLHYKRTHLQSRKEDILTVYKENEKFYKPNKKNPFFTQNIDVFMEFENNLPLEFKYNQHRCVICNYTSDDLNQFMEHESSHYKTNENIDNCTTSTNSTKKKTKKNNAKKNTNTNEKNTNAYCPSRRGRGRGRGTGTGRGRKIIKVNQQQYKLYDCAPSTSSDNSINVCYKGITCGICKVQFTNGQELEIHANKKHMNLYIKLDTNEVETQVNSNRNSIETPAEDPIKMLSNIPNVVAPFQCEVETQINSNRNSIETPVEDPIQILNNIPDVVAPFQCEVETQINSNRISIETPVEDPIKMFSNIPDVIPPFQCVLCKTMCTLREHYEVYEWFSY